MISRRDMLALAAAVTAATPLAQFAVTPERAAALLAEPAEFDPDPAAPFPWQMDGSDPVQFARAIDAADWLEFFDSGAAPEMASYKQALDRVLDHFAVESDLLQGRGHPLTDLDEAALGLWVATWLAGVRAGCQYEHLRLCLVTPRQACRQCHGAGRTWGGTPYRDDAQPAAVCTACAGVGTVATPAAKLSLDNAAG